MGDEMRKAFNGMTTLDQELVRMAALENFLGQVQDIRDASENPHEYSNQGWLYNAAKGTVGR